MQSTANQFMVQISEKKVSACSEDTILSLCKKNRIRIAHSCDGNATCGTCRVTVIEKGKILPPDPDGLEQIIISDRGWGPEARLSCQLLAAEGLVLTIPSQTK